MFKGKPVSETNKFIFFILFKIINKYNRMAMLNLRNSKKEMQST